MSTAVQTRTRDPRVLLNGLAHRVPQLVTENEPALWDREIALLTRDNPIMTKDTAERLLGQAIAYTLTAMERPGTDMGVGYTVDVAVHALILDTPLYFALCDEYNGGRYKHHAPLIERRRDGTVTRTAELLRQNGFTVDDELWAMDAADCSPCNDKVPDTLTGRSRKLNKAPPAASGGGRLRHEPRDALPAQHIIESERELWNAFAESTREKALHDDPVFCWTQYPGHGPGPELLGEPGATLELGFGTGRALGYLLGQGVKVSGVDLSPVAVEAVERRWGTQGARLVCGEVLDHLSSATETYDAAYSIFGAVWFTDPARLFPLIRRRLNPGGVLAFSQPPAIPGAYGPQGMYKGGFAGPAMFTYRYSYTPRKWASLLRNAGFGDVDVHVLDAPTPGHIGTLIARAVAS